MFDAFFTNEVDVEALPPRKQYLVLFHRFALPVAALLTILVVCLATGPYTGVVIPLVWGLVSCLLYGLIVLAHQKSRYIPKFFQNWIGKDSGGRLGIILLIWISLIYIISAPSLGSKTAALLWPAFILPYLLYILRKSNEHQLTKSVIKFTLAVTLVLACGVIIGALQNASSPKPVVQHLIDNYPNLLILLGAVYGLMIIYYAIRLSQLNQIRLEAIVKAFQTLAEADNPMRASMQIAQILCRNAGVGKRVFILFLNLANYELRVSGYDGENAEAEANSEVPRDTGISRRAIKENDTIYVGDTSKKDSGYFSRVIPAKGSEISVPIRAWDENHDSFPIGTINVQDDFRNGFTKGEIHTVEMFADLMGRLIHRYSGGFQSKLSRCLQSLNNYVDEESIIDEIISSAEKLFQCPNVYYVRLALGSGFPLQPPVYGMHCQKKGLFSGARWFRPVGDLVRWIKDWELRIIANTCCENQDQPFSRTYWKDIVDQGGIRSICFMPIGTSQVRLGAVILLFPEEQLFTLIDNINFMRFINEVTPHLLRVQYLTSVIHGLPTPQAELHHIVTGLSKGGWEVLLSEVYQNLPEHQHQLRDELNIFSQHLKTSLTNIRTWIEDPKYTAFLQPDPINFIENLEEALGSVEKQFSGKVFIDYDSSIEAESNDLKMMLFFLIVEAVNNAFLHGKTTKIVYVGIHRYPNDIILDISDDGQGFNPEIIDWKSASGKRSGISKLIATARDVLGARIDPMDTQPYNGTRIKWIVPMLPCDLEGGCDD